MNQSMVQRFRMEVINDEAAAILRGKTSAQRLAGAHDMWRYARVRITALIKHQHPEWTEAQIKQEIRRRMLGSDGVS